MSSFGRSSHMNNNSNYRGGGGGGGRSSGYSRGGGRRGGSRGGGGRGPSSHGGGGGGGGGGQHHVAQQALMRPCHSWTTTGACANGSSCQFAHIVQLHAAVDASKPLPASSSQQQQQQHGNKYQPHNNNFQSSNPTQQQQQQQQQLAPVSAVAIWEVPGGGIKIFTGSHDGTWRLWNTHPQFMQEFESNMSGKVECLEVVNQFLFCGFEAVSRTLPDVPVGMVHAWNLQQPTHPPLELHISRPADLLPYAHNQLVTALTIAGKGADAKIISGSRDGSIRVWAYSEANASFALRQTLPGHAREVTGLVLLPTAYQILWSSSTDGSIRIWDLATAECQYVITRDTTASSTTSPAPHSPPPEAGAGVGHTHAVTSLLSFDSKPAVAGNPPTSFVLSSSLDRTIKAWNGSTGACVASEVHDEGVVCMSLAQDTQGHALLLIGLESGNIMCRNLLQTPRVAAFQLLFTLTARYSAGHDGPCRCLAPGPNATFYSGGEDGKLLVFSFNGDLGLQ